MSSSPLAAGITWRAAAFVIRRVAVVRVARIAALGSVAHALIALFLGVAVAAAVTPAALAAGKTDVRHRNGSFREGITIEGDATRDCTGATGDADCRPGENRSYERVGSRV